MKFSLLCKRLRVGLVLATLVMLQACASTNGDSAPYDPWEGFNRSIYIFNDTVDDYVLKPVAEGYEFITPVIVRKGISNFFSNLLEPTVIINDLLQGKLVNFTSDTGRFLINSSIGIGGLFDVATPMGLRQHKEDFGQTLGVWGLPDGPYLVLPFIGPKGVRDGFGWIGDLGTSPFTYAEPAAAAWGGYALDVVDTRARMLGTKDVLDQAASDDVYIFVREAYRQKRLGLVYDGNPPVENGAAEDDLLFGE
ncbi:MAG: VacJ family lipoprotein [Proteobacteria bacterium]|nr:VacJ family lipoprotein [Pseudomonadota bacterium]